MSTRIRRKLTETDKNQNIDLLIDTFNDSNLSLKSSGGSLISSVGVASSNNEEEGNQGKKVVNRRETVSHLPFEKDEYEDLDDGTKVLKSRTWKEAKVGIPDPLGIMYSIGFYRPVDNYVATRAELISENKKTKLKSVHGNWVRRMLYHVRKKNKWPPTLFHGLFISTGYYYDYYLEKKKKPKIYTGINLDNASRRTPGEEGLNTLISPVKRPTLSYLLLKQRRLLSFARPFTGNDDTERQNTVDEVETNSDKGPVKSRKSRNRKSRSKSIKDKNSGDNFLGRRERIKSFDVKLNLEDIKYNNKDEDEGEGRSETFRSKMSRRNSRRKSKIIQRTESDDDNLSKSGSDYSISSQEGSGKSVLSIDSRASVTSSRPKKNKSIAAKINFKNREKRGTTTL